jgi:hypothetical protein
MPSFDWQSVVALLAVAGAAWFLARRALAVLRAGTKPGSACGSCDSCAASNSAPSRAPSALVSIEEFVTHEDQKEELLGADSPKRGAP